MVLQSELSLARARRSTGDVHLVHANMDNTMRKVALKGTEAHSWGQRSDRHKTDSPCQAEGDYQTIRGRAAHRDAEAGLRRCPGRSIL